MKLIKLEDITFREELYRWTIDYLNLWGALKSHSLSEEDNVYKQDIKRQLLVKLQAILITSENFSIKEDDDFSQSIRVLRQEFFELGATQFEGKYLGHKFDFYAILTWFLDNYLGTNK